MVEFVRSALATFVNVRRPSVAIMSAAMLASTDTSITTSASSHPSSFVSFTMTQQQHQQIWIEFLELYRENSCLWDIHSTSYNRRDLRNTAYNILLQKYRELDPHATLDMVKKKIDIFRTGYRREVKKIQESKEASPPMEYKPTLWYYDKLSFLSILEDVREKTVVVKELTESDDQNEEAAIEYIDIPNDYTIPNPVLTYRLKKRKLESRLSRSRSRSRTEPAPGASFSDEDDCATYCTNLRLQMRELDTEQKYIAQKLISDVIFLARTSQLTLDSSVNA